MKRLAAIAIFCLIPRLAWAVGLGQLLSQANPPATTLTVIYTAPSLPSGGVLITTVWVSNRDSVGHTFRISVAPQAAADDPKQYLYYDLQLPGNSSFVQSVNLPISSGDVVRAYDDAQQLTFQLYGNTAP